MGRRPLTVRPERHSAVVDRVLLEVSTRRPTQHRYVLPVINDQLGAGAASCPFAKPLNAENASGTATRFKICLNEPQNSRQLRAIADALDNRFGLLAPPAVKLLEVALDTFVKGAGKQELAAIVARRACWSAHRRIPGHYWNLYRRGTKLLKETERGEDGAVRLADFGRAMHDLAPRQLIALLADGWQLTDIVGPLDAPHAPVPVAERRHGYVKTTDDGGDKILSVDQWSARMEVQLRFGDAFCGPLSFEELCLFDFKRLSDRFKFMKYATDDVHPAIAHARAQGPFFQWGERGPYRRKLAGSIAETSGRRQFRSFVVADSDLNDQVYAALRKLTRAWAARPRLPRVRISRQSERPKRG